MSRWCGCATKRIYWRLFLCLCLKREGLSLWREGSGGCTPRDLRAGGPQSSTSQNALHKQKLGVVSSDDYWQLAEAKYNSPRSGVWQVRRFTYLSEWLVVRQNWKVCDLAIISFLQVSFSHSADLIWDLFASISNPTSHQEGKRPWSSAGFVTLQVPLEGKVSVILMLDFLPTWTAVCVLKKNTDSQPFHAASTPGETGDCVCFLKKNSFIDKEWLTELKNFNKIGSTWKLLVKHWKWSWLIKVYISSCSRKFNLVVELGNAPQVFACVKVVVWSKAWVVIRQWTEDFLRDGQFEDKPLGYSLN